MADQVAVWLTVTVVVDRDCLRPARQGRVLQVVMTLATAKKTSRGRTTGLVFAPPSAAYLAGERLICDDLVADVAVLLSPDDAEVGTRDAFARILEDLVPILVVR